MTSARGWPAGPMSATQAGGNEPVSREGLLARVFVRLADTLVEEFDVVDFLHSLSLDSVAILSAEAAGVMLADPCG